MGSNELEKPPYDPVRRKLIFGGLAVGGAMILGEAAWLLHTPHVAQPEDERHGLYPGWIEAKISIPFIKLPSFSDTNKGHFPWTREAVFTNPLLFSITRDYFAFLDNCLKSHRQLRLGESFSYVVEKAKTAVGKISPLDQETSYSLEAVHAASIAFAAGFFTWFSPEDMQELGISLTGYQSVTDYYWGPNGIGTNVFPRLFVKENNTQTPQFNGADRSVHFATHLLLTFEYLYSRFYNLKTHQQILDPLKLVLLAKNPQEEALSLSKTLGLGSEVVALLKLRNWPLDAHNPPTEGVFDTLAKADYKGNQLGARAAIALFEQLTAGKPIDPVLIQLNDPKYTSFKTVPIL